MHARFRTRSARSLPRIQCLGIRRKADIADRKGTVEAGGGLGVKSTDCRPPNTDRLLQASAAEGFHIAFTVGGVLERHVGCNPGEGEIRLSAQQFLQGGSGDIGLSRPWRRKW